MATYKDALHLLKSGQHIKLPGWDGGHSRHNTLSYHPKDKPIVSDKTLERLLLIDNVIRINRPNKPDAVFYIQKRKLSGVLAPLISEKITAELGHEDWQVIRVQEMFSKIHLRVYDELSNFLIEKEIKIVLDELLFLE